MPSAHTARRLLLVDTLSSSSSRAMRGILLTESSRAGACTQMRAVEAIERNQVFLLLFDTVAVFP